MAHRKYKVTFEYEARTKEGWKTGRDTIKMVSLHDELSYVKPGIVDIEASCPPNWLVTKIISVEAIEEED